MQRYFVTPAQFAEDRVEITGDDARHITKVMRGRLGDKFILSDGVSREALFKIDDMDGHRVLAVLLEPLEMNHEPRLQVTIAQSLPKGDKMETVIQKCTEIGAVSFVPFLSERTIVQYDAKKEVKRLERWRKIAKEAAEQAHRNRIPAVDQPMSWKNLLAAFDGYDAVYFCYEKESGAQLRDKLKPFVEAVLQADDSKASLLLVVGPEGGFTEQECRAAEQAGAVSVALGRRILRCETAGMTALACALYESGEMGGV
ncbi:16S rRNA (uracil(1498)-N(3))-methyltransferase [Paenibacillus sp. JCM 10914]|uniref:RsmE family RNA methyltransferase n=1 Tax=Paenibacillus sp. JCM 10914 TaxID=1236974 RepID=UPI0003CC3CD4|nr:RsmE family RNA methyltransferase [Paenibacillus sp. JCM 10914]GAE04178.1 ribosomal RNA small subunit methyltransferase E [Paenibacillus sp. JCM 10914]